MADKQARKAGEGQQRSGQEAQGRNLERDQSGRFGSQREGRQNQQGQETNVPARGNASGQQQGKTRRGVEEEE